MSNELPYDPQTYPKFRVKHAAVWNAADTAWVELKMQRDQRGNGFHVESWNREVLPEEGEAVLYFYYGQIDNKNYAIDSLPDLRNHEIRIFQQTGIDADGLPIWETCWWGECIARVDHPWPGSATPAGMVEYHCKDMLHRTGRWPMDRHVAVAADGSVYGVRTGDPGALGHPGYNIRRGSRLIGNRFDQTPLEDLGMDGHTWPGSSASGRWSDLQALVHAIKSSTPAGRFQNTVRYSAPLFTVAGATALFSSATSWWEIEDGEPLRAFLTRLSDRRRGRGTVFGGWTEPDGPEGQLVPFLYVQPQVLDSLTAIPLPSGATFTVPGAYDVSQTVDIDLTGDHRLGSATSFEIAEVADTHYGAVAMYGAPIRVVVPLSTIDDSAAKRWLSGEQTAFAAASVTQRDASVTQFFHVYRTLGIPLDWDFTVARGIDGTGVLRCDYRFVPDFDVNGIPQIQLQAPALADDQDTSPLLVSIADDLPLYAGYDYSVNPAVRYSGSADGREEQLPIQVYKRVNDSPPRFVPLENSMNFTLSRGGSEDRMDLTFHGDETVGRIFEAFYNDPNKIVIVAAIDLPHRLWMCSTSEASATIDLRVKRLYTKEFAVHLAHPRAIVSLDETTESNGGFAAVRANDVTNLPVYLRDDRDLLAQRFHLACLWYLKIRSTATWSLAGCGGAGGWLDIDGTNHPWPALGQVVDQFTANGQTVTLGTPITSIRYQRGITTWLTSWHDRDWSQG